MKNKLIALMLVVVMSISISYEADASAAILLQAAGMIVTAVAANELVAIADQAYAMDILPSFAKNLLSDIYDLYNYSDFEKYEDDKSDIMNSYHASISSAYGSYTTEYYEQLYHTFFEDRIFPTGIGVGDHDTGDDRFINFMEKESQLADAYAKRISVSVSDEGNIAIEMINDEPSSELNELFIEWYKEHISISDGQYHITITEFISGIGEISTTHSFDTKGDCYPYVPSIFRDLFMQVKSDWMRLRSEMVLSQLEGGGDPVYGTVENATIEDFRSIKGVPINGSADLALGINSLGVEAFGQTPIHYSKYEGNYAYFWSNASTTTITILPYSDLGQMIFLNGNLYLPHDGSHYYIYGQNLTATSVNVVGDTLIRDTSEWLVNGTSISNYPKTAYNVGSSSSVPTSIEVEQEDIVFNPTTGHFEASTTGGTVDVPVETDENDLPFIPGDVLGSDVPTQEQIDDAGIQDGLKTPADQALEEIAKNTGSVADNITTWLQAQADTLSRTGTVDESFQLNGGGGFIPSIPNFFILLILILIAILMLFIKGFVIVGLIFKIPESDALFDESVIDAIERTRLLTLGEFNMTIIGFISWIVMFVFTFLLLKTLRKHLSRFNAV